MTILILGNVNHEYRDIDCTHDLEQIPWVPDVAFDLESITGMYVESLVSFATYSIDVSNDTDIGYSLRSFVYTEPEIVIGIDVENLLAFATYSIDVSRDIESLYSVGVIQRDTGSTYSIRHVVESDTLSTYGINLYIDYGDIESKHSLLVGSDTEINYSIFQRVNYDLEAPYYLISSLYSDIESSFDIIVVNPVHRDLRAVYMLYSPTSETIITDALITVNDEF